MPVQQQMLPYDAVVRVRHDYVNGKTVARITAEYLITRHKLYRLLAGEVEAASLPPIKRRDPRARIPADTRAAVVERLWRAADRQVRDVEKRLRLNDQKPDERERDARVLATTVKTLRDLRALDAARAETEPSAEDDKGIDNLDDFRRELARKMDTVIAARAAAGSGDDGSQ
jgi:hypothetical protein